jgi:hypothetical protein
MHRMNTVFNKLQPDLMHPNEILAVVFHRTAAILYAIYAAWGVAAFITNFEQFALENGHDFFDYFTMLVTPVAVTAFVGALFFPKTGRLEMFAASALATLIVVFLVLSFIAGDQQEPHFWQNFILNTTHLVVPVMRVGFIFRTLVWESMKKGL